MVIRHSLYLPLILYFSPLLYYTSCSPSYLLVSFLSLPFPLPLPLLLVLFPLLPLPVTFLCRFLFHHPSLPLSYSPSSLSLPPSSSHTPGRLGAFNYPEIMSALSVDMHSPLSPPYISPNGSIFCSPAVRIGVLPQVRCV